MFVCVHVHGLFRVVLVVLLVVLLVPVLALRRTAASAAACRGRRETCGNARSWRSLCRWRACWPRREPVSPVRRRVHWQQHPHLVSRAAAFCRVLSRAFLCIAKVCYVPVIARAEPRCWGFARPVNDFKPDEVQRDARPLGTWHVHLVSCVELEHEVENSTHLLLSACAGLRRGQLPRCAWQQDWRHSLHQSRAQL
jgi:hypothetical protein